MPVTYPTYILCIVVETQSCLTHCSESKRSEARKAMTVRKADKARKKKGARPDRQSQVACQLASAEKQAAMQPYAVWFGTIRA